MKKKTVKRYEPSPVLSLSAAGVVKDSNLRIWELMPEVLMQEITPLALDWVPLIVELS